MIFFLFFFKELHGDLLRGKIATNTKTEVTGSEPFEKLPLEVSMIGPAQRSPEASRIFSVCRQPPPGRAARNICRYTAPRKPTTPMPTVTRQFFLKNGC